MKKTKIGLIVTLLFITVAFASVTTTLVLNGTLSLGTDNRAFEADVVFTDSVTMIGGEYTLSRGNKTLEFTLDQLNMLESEAVLSYEVQNNNRQYDATAEIKCTPVDAIYEDYISIEVNPSSSFILNALDTQSGTVKVKLIRSITGDASEIPFSCTITAEAVERDSLQKDPSRFETEDMNFAPGSEICLEDECFNVVETTDETVTMLAKYNISPDDYRQRTLATGIPYDDGVSIILDNYAKYINELTRIKDTNSIVVTLISKDALTTKYGCVLETPEEEGAASILTCATSPNSGWLVTNQDFYLLASESDATISSIDSNGVVVNSNNAGVRPLVTIPKNLIIKAN